MIDSRNLKVLIASSECAPFSKSGGLGDVIGSLPKELKKFNIDARVVIPKYKTINSDLVKDIKYIDSFSFKTEQDIETGKVYLADDYVYLIENEDYFNRSNYYGYEDDFKRFSFFSRAILEMLNILDFKPDIIHFNDWQTALGPLYLKEKYEKFTDIKSIFTIHNIQYQGVFSKDTLKEIDLNESYYNFNIIEFYGNINFMKAGIIYSDIITTVSKTYSEEIKTYEYGYALDGVLKNRENSLFYILNGIPDDNFHDIFNFKKDKCKLQKSFNLPIKDVPIISIVSRFVEQKGIDLIVDSLDEILNKDIQFIVLGTGEQKYEEIFKKYAIKYKDKLSANIFFGDEISKQIYMHSDIFLIPSLFEPCGLSQMLAMKYGTIPLVRKTGGLADTVKQYDKNTKKGNGFVFLEYSKKEFMKALDTSLEVFNNKKEWKKIINNAMEEDFSWEKSTKKYIDLYTKLKKNII